MRHLKKKLLVLSIALVAFLFTSCGDNEKSTSKVITKVIVNSNPKVDATIDEANKNITATVSVGTDLTKITLEITHSGASISPDPKSSQDFSDGREVNYVVKAEDGSTRVYTVRIAVAKKLSSNKAIFGVVVNTSPKVIASINDTYKTIIATVAYATDLTAITLEISHGGVSISPDPKTPQDFSGGKSVTYTVKAEDGSTQVYTVSLNMEKETILQSVSISGFMGESSSDITITLKPAGTYKLYISNDANCDISNYKNCANAEMIEITGDSKTFNSKTLTISTEETTHFIVQDSKDSHKITKKATVFSPRLGHQVVVFNKKMYLISGGQINNPKNDVYSSSDGINWKQETASASFTPRLFHQVVVFKDKMYLIAGGDGSPSGDKNDVYSSSDGKIWKEETPRASFFPRFGHQVVVFNKRIYLIAGASTDTDDKSKSIKKNDVYSSSDGKIWKEETPRASFSARTIHQVVIFNKKMYLVAGISNSGESGKNDVYSSSDGKTWNEETPKASFSARAGHQVVVFNKKMYLIGGYSGTSSKNDVWQSADGKTWKKAFGLSFSK